jgi:hypothetical protein
MSHAVDWRIEIRDDTISIFESTELGSKINLSIRLRV